MRGIWALVFVIVVVYAAGSALACENACATIISDGLFALAGDSQTSAQSPWKIQASNYSYISFQSERVISQYENPQGEYYAVLDTRGIVSLSQNITLPAIPSNKSLKLNAFVYLVSVGNPQYLISLYVYIDETLIYKVPAATKNNVMLDVTPFQNGTHTLSFRVSATSNMNNYFLHYIDYVDISVRWNTPINADVYVSSSSGNDLLADGTSLKPFCSLYAALNAVAAGRVVRVEGGSYCHPMDHNIAISKSISIIGYQNSNNSWPLFDLHYRWTAIAATNIPYLNLSSMIFLNSYTQFFTVQKVANVELTNITFNNATSYFVGFADVDKSASGVYIVDCPQVDIVDCSFIDLILYSITAVNAANVSITNISATNAPVLYTQNSTASVNRATIAYTTDNTISCLQLTFSTLAFTDITMQFCDLASTTSKVDMQNIVVAENGDIIGRADTFRLFNTQFTMRRAAFSNIGGGVTDFVSVSDKDTNATFESCTFTNLNARQSFAVSYGSLRIFNSTFNKGSEPLTFLGTVYNNGILTFDTVTISDLIRDLNPLLAIAQGNLKFIDSVLTGNTAVLTSNSYGTIEIKGSKIIGNRAKMLFQGSYGNITVQNSHFSQNNVDSGTFFLASSLLNFNNCTYESNVGNYSAGFRVSNSTVFINGGTFKNNTAGTSILYQTTSNVTISNAEITQNNGVLEGGCFSVNGRLTVVNCSITGNKAEYGGVAYITNERTKNEGFVNSELIFNGTLIANNQAKIAGSVLFSLSDNNGFLNFGSTIENNTSPVIYDIAATQATEFVLSSKPLSQFVSGESVLPSFSVVLKDAYNQTAHQNATIYLKVGDRNLAAASAVEGVAVFDPVPLFGPIGANSTLTFYTSNFTIPTQIFPVTIAGCNPGYYPSSGDVCVGCPAKTYGYDGKTCVACPSNAYCLGGAEVNTLPGYWYSEGVVPRTLYKCPGKSCPGNNTCSANHKGIVCAECQDGFYDWGTGCQECDKVSGPIIVIGLVIAIVIVVWFHREGSDTGLITVVSYFVQTLMILADGVNFGFLSFLNFQIGDNKSTGGVSVYKLCPGPFGFYDRYYFTYVAPIILFALLLLGIAVEQLLHLIRILKTPDRGRQNGAIVNLVLFIYSPITNNVFGIFFCTRIAETLLLVANNAVHCSGSQYHKAEKVAIAFLVIVSLIPVALLIFLFMRRNQLEKESNKRIWGALYLQFKPQYYYWNIVILVRRFVIIILALLSAERDTRALLLVIATLVTMVLQLKCMPFRTKMDNFLESVSLVGLFVFSCFLDNGNQVTYQWVVLAIGVIFGICLLFSVVVMLAQKISEKLGKKEPKFTRVFSDKSLGTTSGLTASTGSEMSAM